VEENRKHGKFVGCKKEKQLNKKPSSKQARTGAKCYKQISTVSTEHYPKGEVKKYMVVSNEEEKSEGRGDDERRPHFRRD
jgi:hypothetical protein